MLPGHHSGERSTPAGGHLPVLLRETLTACAVQPSDCVVDCTLGLGGHAKALIEQLGPEGRFVGLDRDASSVNRVRQLFSENKLVAATSSPTTPVPRISLHHANFAALPEVLAIAGESTANVIVADLGVSSIQIDDASRGFSYARPGPLDMRMDPSKQQTASKLLAELSEADLAAAFAELGDEPQADAIAKAIVRSRKAQRLTTTDELVGIVLASTVDPRTGRRNDLRLHRGNRTIVARVFQALRIMVNRELAALETLLRVLPQSLAPGGRAALIAFHSGEDRLVKESLRTGFRSGIYSAVAADAVRAGEAEIESNPRSRSAKLRWAIRAEK